MEGLAEIPVDRDRARVYEHGWQSWSPTMAYRLDERPFRPVSEARRVGNYHPDRTAPRDAFWGEGLLAVDPGTGAGVHVFAARSAGGPMPSIRAEVTGDRVVVSAGGEVNISWSTPPAPTRRGRRWTMLWPDGPTTSRPRTTWARSGRRRRRGAPGTTTSSA